jgi:GT2 family glycosyltransferase
MGTVLLTIIESLYILGLLSMAIYGLNSLWLTLLYLKSKNRPTEGWSVSDAMPPWPRVTVQLPIFNERYTVERLLDAVARLDYPRDRLQVQVLDDSTDLTTPLVRQWVAKHQAQGLDIELIRRTARTGFKAGALAEGLKSATGELIAMFDADFVPAADWLRRTVIEFRDPRLGCLQTHWGHLNRNYNLLTQAQALAFDGHFVVEQVARSRNGLLLNFNGAAGVWRRAAIDDAGGWQADTLTEDLDLSFRAQLRGWRIGYLPDVIVPAELPAQMDAFKQQQFRWAKGAMQTLRKLLPRLWQADIPWRVRLEASVHLVSYVVHPMMLMMLLLTPVVGLWAGAVQRYFPLTGLVAFGPPLLYSMAQMPDTRLCDRLRVLPLLLLLGYGLSFNNSIAVVEGLIGRGGDFYRTPKFNLRDRDGQWADNIYTMRNSIAWGEIALAGYTLGTMALLWPKDGWATLPWLTGYAAGYLFIAGLGLVQDWQLRHVRPYIKSAGHSPISV